MSQTYQTVDEDSSDTDNNSENTLGEALRPEEISRCARCMDFCCCRQNRGTFALVVVDLLYLASTVWMFGDVVLALFSQHVLGHGGEWWFYVIMSIPPLMQVFCVMARIRYVLMFEKNKLNVDWHLRHVSRPITVSVVNGLAFDAYLFALPLYAAALLQKDVGTMTISEFANMWRITTLQPSSMAFNITYLVVTFVNWRVSAKHRWLLKVYIGKLRSKSRQWDRECEYRLAAANSTSVYSRPAPQAHMAEQRADLLARVAPNSPRQTLRSLSDRSGAAAELRVVHTSETFVPEQSLDSYAGDKNRRPRGKKHKSSSRSSSNKTNRKTILNTRGADHTSSRTSQTSLDDSVHSRGGVDNEKW